MPENSDQTGQREQVVPELTRVDSVTGFMKIIERLVKYRVFISRFILGVTLLAVVVTLLLPKWYKSTASVFPAEKADLFGALEGVSSLVKSFAPGRALSSLTGNAETDRYLAILKSATVLDAVIEHFNLVEVYDITSYPREKTTKELLSNVEFKVETEGNLTISVYDQDPHRAAAMANFFVEMLNKTNTELSVQNARSNRRFVEERYNKNLQDLAIAEDSLRLFQQRHGIIALPEQTEASIKAAGELAGQLALKEVQEGVLRRTQMEGHPSVMSLQAEITELRRKLAEMNRGSGTAKEGDMRLFVPFNEVPQLAGEYIRRYRDVEIQYKILQFITPLYEQAKVEERRQTPSVLVLDIAQPAERKAKPKVILFGLIALVGSTLITLFVILLLELLEQLRNSYPSRYEDIRRTVKNDWFGLRSTRSERQDQRSL